MLKKIKILITKKVIKATFDDEVNGERLKIYARLIFNNWLLLELSTIKTHNGNENNNSMHPQKVKLNDFLKSIALNFIHINEFLFFLKD